MSVEQAEDAQGASAERQAESMGGLAKGLAIIEAFAQAEGLNVADAARAAGATRAAARRCLLTLADLGYVERVGRTFRPLPRLRHLGRAGGLRERLIEASAAILASARDTLDESVSLAMLEGDVVVFIARAEAQHIVSTGVRVGANLPAYCAATGRVLLAGRPTADVREILGRAPLPARTRRTLTNPAAILREIAAVADAGYAISDEELEIGMRALAVPVRDVQGAVIAALSVSAYAARVNRGDMQGRFLAILRQAATNLESRLR